ncbi:MAG: ABC transporter ATP-binding protein [Thermoleophilia bacterium]|nr:ABC transporter ATP-binding protein [Thermoleophilia bacterium]
MSAPAHAPHGTQVLDARGVTYGYGRSGAVLRGVDLQLRAGELVALLGPNGSGKTTLMGVLVGVLPADSGEVEVEGGGDACGWVPQSGGTYARLTVRENLELFAALNKLPGDRRATAELIAEDAGLSRWLDRLCSQLSGGLRQRLNIAIGLLGDPRVLVLDEPTTGVDIVHRSSMWRVLRERADRGSAVLYSTHSGEDAALADRVVVMVEGRIAFSGTLAGVGEIGARVRVSGDAAAANGGSLIDESVRGASDDVTLGLLSLWSGEQH